jgi:hypothetical protein
MQAEVNLETLWQHRGGFKATFRRLMGYACQCIDRRSTKSAGGQQVAKENPEDVVQEAIFRAFTSDDSPRDGEEFYKLVRRNIDNPLRTLEKSPKAARTIGAINQPGIPGTVDIGTIADPSSAESKILDAEDEFYTIVANEVRKRLNKPNGQETQLLNLVIERTGTKEELCALLKIDSATFDRVKNRLKNVVVAAINDLKKTAKK